MATSSKTVRRKTKQPTEITFDYIKSNFFRVIHADGAFGGLAPNGNIHMALYNERQAIPTKMVYPIEGTGLGPEIRKKRKGREGLVREVEVDVILSIEQAQALHTWLTNKIEAFETVSDLRVADRSAPAKLKSHAKVKSRAKAKPRKLNGGSTRGVSKK